MAVPMLDVDQKRRLVRRLLDQQGRGLAEAYGFTVTSSPSNLFSLLYLAQLAADHDYRRATTLAGEVRERWDSAAELASAAPEERADALRVGGAGRSAQQLAATLGDLAQAVVAEYRGDLRQLRTRAGRQPARERRLLTALPGIDSRAADVFFQEVQVLWPEIGPFADQRALRAAARLGLGGGVAELVELTGDESEKLAWLAGALDRVDQDGAYEDAQALAYT